MRMRILGSFVRVVSLALALSAPSALAQRADTAPGMLAVQQQAQNAQLVGQIGGPLRALAVQGDYAYVGAGPRLLVVDVSTPFTPTMVGQTGVLAGVVEDVSVACAPFMSSHRAPILRRATAIRPAML